MSKANLNDVVIVIRPDEPVVDSGVDVNSAVAMNSSAPNDSGRFGGRCYYFNGNAYFSIDAGEWTNSDFTVDWWEYPTETTSGVRFTSLFCDTYASQAGGLLVGVVDGSAPNFMTFASTTYGSISNWNLMNSKVSGSNILNTWTHRAVVREGTNLKFYVNGTLEYTFNIGNTIGYNSSRPMAVGAWANDFRTTGYAFVGYIDEFRITRKAVWTSNFTVPSARYTGGEFGEGDDESETPVVSSNVIDFYNAMLRRRLFGAGKSTIPTRDLVFSYSISSHWSDVELTIDGQLYRVLTMDHGAYGTLTLDPRMVSEQIPFDIWVVTGGAQGEAGADYIEYYGSGHCATCGDEYTYGYGSDGWEGSDGGWGFIYNVISPTTTLYPQVSEGSFYMATSKYASNTSIANYSGWTRPGNPWFSLPAHSNGEGGWGGSGGYEELTGGCPDHDSSSYWVSATEGEYGTPGLVAIRIPIY